MDSMRSTIVRVGTYGPDGPDVLAEYVTDEYGRRSPKVIRHFHAERGGFPHRIVEIPEGDPRIPTLGKRATQEVVRLAEELPTLEKV